MSLTITIAGTDKTSSLRNNTFELTNAIGQRDTFSAVIKSDDGSYRPDPGARVVVEHSELGNLFGGTIRGGDVTEHAVACETRIQCASWEQIFDRRLTGQVSYTDQPAGTVFQDVFTRFLGAEELTASIVVSGPNISVKFDFCTVREAFDQICSLASDDTDTYMWDCRNRVTRFYKQTSFPAPFDATADNPYVIRPVTVSYSFSDYCNKVLVRVPDLTTEARTQRFDTDGTTKTFTCDLPLAAEPTITYTYWVEDLSADTSETFSTGVLDTPVYYMAHPVSVLISAIIDGTTDVTSDCTITEGQPGIAVSNAGWAIKKPIVFTYKYDLQTTTPVTDTMTVGNVVDGSKDFYWTEGSPDIVQEDLDTALARPGYLTVTYKGLQDTVVDAGQNETEVAARQAQEGGSGWYMKLIDGKPGIASEAVAYGQAYLAKYSKVPFAVEYRTTYGGVRAGMYQRIQQTKFGASFDDTFLIESSTLVQEGGMWFWRVRAVNGAMAGGWIAKIRQLAQPGTGGGSFVSTTGGEGGTSVTINSVPVTY